MSLVMLCFPCCAEEQPQPKRRPRIDRSQIGLPTNFQHTGHIGSGEAATAFDVQQVQNSMQSKGGYSESEASELPTPDGIEVGNNANVNSMKSTSHSEITITLNNDGS